MFCILIYIWSYYKKVEVIDDKPASKIKYRTTVLATKIGIYLAPALTLPFFIVAMIIEEKRDVIIKDTIANILKSLNLIPEPEKLINTPSPAVPPGVPPKIPPIFVNFI